jgi:uncharacterized membrane protein YdbT with pleckstrin-like domain
MAVADNLIANEAIEFRSRKHWAAPIRASGVAILLLIGFVLIRWISPDQDGGIVGSIGSLLDLVAWGLLIAGVVWIIYNIIAWRTAEFVVTNLRVIREEGLLQHRSSATLISSISDVQSRVGMIGKALRYGDLVILGQSGSAGADRYLCITEPEGFRNAIMTRKMSGSTAPNVQEAVAAAATPAPAAAPAATMEAAAPVVAAAAAPVMAAAAAPAASDPAAALSSLADLRDRGAITAEEFEAKKAEILARM